MERFFNCRRRGQLAATDRLKPPGGEWTAAGAFGPLRPAFQAAQRVAPVGVARTSGTPELGTPPLRAAFGAVLGVGAGAAAWWTVAVAVGEEHPVAALLVGLVVGGLARLFAGAPSGLVGGIGAFASALALVLGRVLFFETLQSPVMQPGEEFPPAPSEFASQGMTPVALGLLAAGVLLAFVLGAARRRS